MIDFQLGPEFNTFTIQGRCERTGQLGIAITTSSINVGARCPHVKANVGTVATQAITDPRLGPLGIQLLGRGYSASKVLEELAASDPWIEYRQLGVVDWDGNSAARTGSSNHDWKGHIAKRNYVSMGNYLVGEQVVEAMAQAFEKYEQDSLEERLMRGIEAGRDAGGQPQGQSSAAIYVYDREPYSLVDLRVDHHEEPVGELRRVLELFKPQIPYYRIQPMKPQIGTLDEWLKQRAS